MSQPDPKPQRRVKDRSASRRKLESDPVCRNCGNRAADGHHILLRSQSGDDVEDNIMPLCHDCHMGYHSGAVRQLKISQREYLYVLGRLGATAGEDYLKRRYGFSGPEWIK